MSKNGPNPCVFRVITTPNPPGLVKSYRLLRVGTPARTTNTFQSFFSPKAGAKERNEGGADYEVVVKKSSYHPVDDSFWKRGEKTPYLALAKTLQAIEDTSGRLKTIEILSNYFR